MMSSWNLVFLAVVFNAASMVMSGPVVSGSAVTSTGSADPITSTVLPTDPPTTITVVPTGSIPASSSLPATSGPVTSSIPASGTFATTTTIAPTSTPVPSVQINPNGNIAKCLDVKGAVFANGTPVQIYDCNHTPAQQWVIVPGEGHVQLANTNFCLDAGATPALGTGMKIWQCFDNLPAQDWFYTADKRIALTNQGFCLDLTDGDLTNGRQTQIWTCTDNNTHQVWSTSMATVLPPPVSTTLPVSPVPTTSLVTTASPVSTA